MNLDSYSFWYLVHVILILSYLWEIGVWIKNRSEHSDLIAMLKKSQPNFLNNTDGEKSNIIGFAIFLGGIHCIVWGMFVVEAWPVGLMILIGLSLTADLQNTNLKEALTEILNAKQKIPNLNEWDESDFGGNDAADDGYFDFKEETSGSRRRADPQPDPAPRGFEQRHPKDAALWAIVDDPASPAGERRNAFDKILKRQENRNTSSKRPAETVRKLLGMSR